MDYIDYYDYFFLARWNMEGPMTFHAWSALPQWKQEKDTRAESVAQSGGQVAVTLIKSVIKWGFSF